jgi:hypothetical protein
MTSSWLLLFAVVAGIYEIDTKDCAQHMARACILAEFAASFQRRMQICIVGVKKAQVLASLFLFAIYVAVFIAAYFIETRILCKEI